MTKQQQNLSSFEKIDREAELGRLDRLVSISNDQTRREVEDEADDPGNTERPLQVDPTSNASAVHQFGRFRKHTV